MCIRDRLIGIILGKFLFAKNTQKQVEEAELTANKLVEAAKDKAEALKKEKILEAKEHFQQLKSEHEKEALQRNQKIAEAEARIKQQQQSVNDKLSLIHI